MTFSLSRSVSPTTDNLSRELRAFLAECAARAFVLGTHDCGLFLADWVLRIRGTDPAAPIRGRYADQVELMALAGAGGLPRLFDRLLRAGGLERTTEPRLGDVAMVAVADYPPCGAIRTAGGYALLAERGLSGVSARGVRLIMAWTFQ